MENDYSNERINSLTSETVRKETRAILLFFDYSGFSTSSLLPYRGIQSGVGGRRGLTPGTVQLSGRKEERYNG